MNAIQNAYLIAASMICPYCGAPVEFKSNEVIYRHNFNNGFVYICARFPECNSYVAAHSVSRKPLGILADKNTRDLRKSVFRIVSPYWQKGLVRKQTVYETIAKILNKEGAFISIAQLNKNECNTVLSQWFYYFEPAHVLQAQRKVQKRF